MVKRVFLFCICFYLLITVCFGQNRTLGFSIDPGRKRVQIPFELQNNLIVVPVVINGMLPLRFIIDTGVQTAILTEKSFADILDLKYSRKYSISGPGGEKVVAAYVTNNVSLDLPGVHGRGHAMLVLEEDYLQLRNYLGTDIHGILGYELFSRFLVEIDYQKKILTISNPHKIAKKRKVQVIPITVEETKPYLLAEVTMKDGTTLSTKLLIDTGASHGLMLEPDSNPLITIPENTISSQIGRGLGGEITGKVGRIQALKIGSFTLDDPIASFPDPNSYMDSLKRGRTKRNGTLGGEILSRFNVTFDFSRELLYLKKNSSFKKKFYYNLSGVILKAKGSALNTFEVVEVRKESPGAKADVRMGDIVSEVNGLDAKDLTLNQVLSYFNSRPGKKISFEVQRNGQRLKRKITLADQI